LVSDSAMMRLLSLSPLSTARAAHWIGSTADDRPESDGAGPPSPANHSLMSLESVRAWLAEHAPDLPLIEVAESTATVATAAAALGVEPGRIAKTLAVRANGETFLLVARGDARLDNAKTKAAFAGRPRMLGPEETLALTAPPPGGVCPLHLPTPLPVYLDVSLQAFDTIFPAAGSLNSSVRLSPS